MLLTAGRLSVCAARSNTAVELSKQGPASQLIAQRRAKQEESSPLCLLPGLPGYTEVNGAQVSFLPSSPSLGGFDFFLQPKGFAIMGVARPGLLHLGLWNDSAQAVKQL